MSRRSMQVAAVACILAVTLLVAVSFACGVMPTHREAAGAGFIVGLAILVITESWGDR